MAPGPAIVDVNDSEVRVGWGGMVRGTSPGYAIIGNRDVILGDEARKLARLKPRDANSQFWNRLNLDSLGNSHATIRHHADLAYAHLRQVCADADAPPDVVFAVPGRFDREQLSLLLGLAKAGKLNPVGLVDSAVAAVASGAEPGMHVHIDVELHHALITQLEVGDEVERVHVEWVAGAGVNAVLDAWAGAATDAFIRQNRFDPLHGASTEQNLYDALNAVWQSASTGPVVLDIHGHRVRLSMDRLIQAAQPIYARLEARARELLSGSPAAGAVYLSHRCTALPGLADRCAPVRHLSPEAVIAGCETHARFLRGDGPELQFVTRLPAAMAAASPPVTVPATPTAAPSHIVCAGRAYPLGTARLYARRHHDGVEIVTQRAPGTFLVFAPTASGVEAQDVDGHPVSLNGAPLAGGIQLVPGDVLRLAGVDVPLTAIRVVDEVQA